MIEIRLPGKPLLINSINRGSWHAVARERAWWRDHAHAWAKYTRVPKAIAPAWIHVRTTTMGKQFDHGAEYMAAKGSIDGLVDAGVLTDDSPKYVAGITFHSCTKGDKDELVLKLVKSPLVTFDQIGVLEDLGGDA